MEKYLLTFEFRYKSTPKGEHDSEHKTKTVTIGIFESFEAALIEGNTQLETLSKTFDIRDKFTSKGLFGQPTRMVTNVCTLDKVHFFANITTLNFYDLSEVVQETLKARRDYDKNKIY